MDKMQNVAGACKLDEKKITNGLTRRQNFVLAMEETPLQIRQTSQPRRPP